MHNQSIANTIVSESERAAFVDRLFGVQYVLKLEPTVFSMAERLAPDYAGGYWEFHVLGNGGFYMAPRVDTELSICCENGYEASLSSDAFGLTVSMYAFCELSFAADTMAQTCAQQYHLLREYVAEHPEARSIYRAID